MLSILQSMPEFDPQIAAEFGNGMSASTFLGVREGNEEKRQRVGRTGGQRKA